MAVLARSLAALRVIGDDLNPEEISTLLRHEPTHSQRRGEIISRKSGDRIATFGFWRLEAMTKEPEDMNAQVVEILGKLTDDLVVWHELKERFRVNLFCGWFMHESNEGVSLSPDSLTALGERSIELDIDLYAPSSDA